MSQSQEADNKLSGRWTREEHQQFMYAIMQYGKDWKKVEQYVKTRSGSQVRSHAQKFFNKLQKPGQGHNQQNLRQPNEHSQTQFDVQRQINNDITPCTPIELVSLIRKQSKEAGKINVSDFKKSLQQQQQKKNMESNQEGHDFEKKAKNFKSMSNILSVYEEVKKEDELKNQDQSFFISITKKYKKLFKQAEDFERLIDLQGTKGSIDNTPRQGSIRKRSFTLLDSSDLSQNQLDQKIEEIKKKIKSQNKEGSTTEGNDVKQKRQKRDEDKSTGMNPPPLNKLSTIQQHPREQEQFISNRYIEISEKQQSPEKKQQSPEKN